MRGQLTPYAYSKVILKPGGQLSITGDLTNASPAMSFYAYVFNASQQQLLRIVNVNVPVGQTVPFTSSPVLTNTGTTAATYYIRWVHASTVNNALMPASNITIHADTAKLTLFLNAHDPSDLDPTHVNTTHFDTAHPDDSNDANRYVPGARMTDNPTDPNNGTSWGLPTSTSPIQTIQVIAAYVDDQGAIVPAPPSTQDVLFTLNDALGQSTASAFDGIAMNYADLRPQGNSAPDFVLLSTSSPIDPVTKIGWVSLQCWDYGGFATITASQAGASASMRLPMDGNHNWLPDSGWKSSGDAVSDGGSMFSDTETGPSGNLNVGDGFVDFEEYRGFVAVGQHVRLNPATKDLFVVSLLPQGVGFTDNLLINVIPAQANEFSQDGNRVINYRWDNYNQSAESDVYYPYVGAHYVQRAAYIIPDTEDPFSQDFGQTYSTKLEPYTLIDVTAASRIFVWRIAEYSPDHNDHVNLSDPFDYETIQSTIAHEAGHQVGLDDLPDATCPLPPLHWTVMIDGYYRSPTTDLTSCPWNAIPHEYQPSELSSTFLR